MLKLDDWSQGALKRNSSYIKQLKKEEKKLLETLSEIREDIIEYRMSSRRLIGRMNCELISKNYALTIIENMGSESYLGLYWTKENGVYVGIDNTTGNAWTEEFERLEDCINWLMGEELK